MTIRSVTQWKQVIAMATREYHVGHKLTSKTQSALCYRNCICILTCHVDFLPMCEHYSVKTIMFFFFPLVLSSFILIQNWTNGKACLVFDVRTTKSLLKVINKRCTTVKCERTPAYEQLKDKRLRLCLRAFQLPFKIAVHWPRAIFLVLFV